MKYHTKKYEDTKFPDAIIKQVLNTFINIYAEGDFYLTLSKDNCIQSYKDLNIFFTDYNQNNYITNIECIVLNIPQIKIEFNMYHTTIFLLNCTTLDFNKIIQPLENYYRHN